MSIHKIATLIRKGHIHLFSWWPKLLRKQEGDRIVSWAMPDLSYHLRVFLTEKHKDEKDFYLHTKGLNDIGLYGINPFIYNEEEYLIPGMIYLIASTPDFMAKMNQWLIENGFEIGEYDEE